jgi:hypothetical protein
VLALGGLVLMLRGARFAKLLTCVVFAGLGAVAGKLGGPMLGAPEAPSIGGAAVVGLVMGLVGFRLWQAVLLGASLAAVAAGVYYVRVLDPHVRNFTSAGFSQSGEVTLPGASASTMSTGENVRQLWDYCAANVPNFQMQFGSLVSATLLAGLVIGLLIPRVSRSLLAATLGTFCFIAGVGLILQLLAPSLVTQLGAYGTWMWALVGALWTTSFGYNLMTCRDGKKKDEPKDEAAPPANPRRAAPATA